jgi:hypothetical protein
MRASVIGRLFVAGQGLSTADPAGTRVNTAAPPAAPARDGSLICLAASSRIAPSTVRHGIRTIAHDTRNVQTDPD